MKLAVEVPEFKLLITGVTVRMPWARCVQGNHPKCFRNDCIPRVITGCRCTHCLFHRFHHASLFNSCRPSSNATLTGRGFQVLNTTPRLLRTCHNALLSRMSNSARHFLDCRAFTDLQGKYHNLRLHLIMPY